MTKKQPQDKKATKQRTKERKRVIVKGRTEYEVTK